MVIASLIFTFLCLTMQRITRADGITISRWRVVKSGIENLKTEELPGSFDFILKKPSYLILETEVPASTGVSYLYIPQIVTSYLKVYADETPIGSFGMSEFKAGKIWYQPLIFEVPPGTERLSLEMHGIYELGINISAVLSPSLPTEYYILRLMTSLLLILAIGGGIFLGWTMISISKRLLGKARAAHAHIGLAAILGSVWLLDLLPFQNIGSAANLLAIRKIFLSSFYVGLGMTVMGASKVLELRGFRTNFLDKLFFFTGLSVAVLFWFVPTNYHMKIMTGKMAPIALIAIFYLFFQAVRLGKGVIVTSMAFGAMTGIRDALIVMLNMGEMEMLSHYGLMTIFMGFTYFLIADYENTLRLFRVSEEKISIDPLTKAYNRNALERILATENDSIVFVDMNGFKKINDRYGHKMGDELLKGFVDLLKERLRASDIIVRLGGDEFIVVMRNCSKDKANEIFESLNDEFKRRFEIGPSFSFGAVQFQNSLEDSISLADKVMYEMKRRS